MERLYELAETPGWGVVFTAWALALAVGVAIVAVTALVSWRSRAKRRRAERGGR
jgi:heme/copper-type cytochrome/quinol oxidase subunit 1